MRQHTVVDAPTEEWSNDNNNESKLSAQSHDLCNTRRIWYGTNLPLLSHVRLGVLLEEGLVKYAISKARCGRGVFLTRLGDFLPHNGWLDLILDFFNQSRDKWVWASRLSSYLSLELDCCEVRREEEEETTRGTNAFVIITRKLDDGVQVMRTCRWTCTKIQWYGLAPSKSEIHLRLSRHSLARES